MSLVLPGVNVEVSTTISRRIEWDMGHRVPNHGSLCRNPHGHRYVAEVEVQGPIIDKEGSPEEGMVMDFGSLKHSLRFISEELDHAFMVYSGDPFNGALALFDRQQKQGFQEEGRPLRVVEVEFIPTAENIAVYILKRMVQRGIDVLQVTVWETPNCKAIAKRSS